MWVKDTDNNTNGRPVISVVIPVFNKAETIGQTILSACQQTFKEIEILVVDDGSVDESVKKAKEIDDHRVRIISQSNHGQSVARNKGIQSASGAFVAFLDADDTWDTCHLESMIDLVRRFPEAGMYATGYRTELSTGQSTKLTVRGGRKQVDGFTLPDYFRLAARAPIIWVGAVMVPGQVFREIGGFLPGEHRGGDREMWARIACNYEVAYIPRVSATYDCGAVGRESNKHRALQWPPMLNVLNEELRTSVAGGEKYTQGVRQYRNKVLLGFASKAIVANDRAMAVAAVRETSIFSFASFIQITWTYILLLCPSNTASVMLRIVGSRVFFPIKKYWLRLHGIDFAY